MRLLRKLTIAKFLMCLLLSTTPLWGQISPDSLVVAIAKAEGFGQKKSNLPTRCHNPGDLKTIRGFRYWGQIGVCNGGHVRFRNDATGWYALRAQVQKMLDGRSRVYSVRMSINDIARKYAGNYKVWANNVSHTLGVPASTTLAEMFDILPSLNEVLPTPRLTTVINCRGCFAFT